MGIKALERALKVLRCFDALAPEWGVTELSLRTGFEKSHISKILREFTLAGLLVQDPATRRYRIGAAAMALGSGYMARSTFARIGRRYLHDLASVTGLTATLAAFETDGVFYLMSVEGRFGVTARWPVGSRLNLHSTASGKIFAAFVESARAADLLARPTLPKATRSTIRSPDVLRRELARVRRDGYAEEAGENTSDLGAMAVPVYGADADIVGALSLLYRYSPHGRDECRQYLPALRETAKQYGRDLADPTTAAQRGL